MLEYNKQNLSNVYKTALIRNIDKLSNLSREFTYITYKFDNMHWVFKTILYIPFGMIMQNNYLRQMKKVNKDIAELNNNLKDINKHLIWTK